MWYFHFDQMFGFEEMDKISVDKVYVALLKQAE